MMKIWFLLPLLVCSIVRANCTIYFKSQPLSERMADPLFWLLSHSSTCPQSILSLKQIMQDQRLQAQISIVANRGRQNPVKGNFSIFESISGTLSSNTSNRALTTVYRLEDLSWLHGKEEQELIVKRGDFFIGYFTKLKGNTIILDQKPKNKKLLIEVIAWDKHKSLYNFYELRGIENGLTQWFYRGDSLDAYKDNTWLYRNNPDDENHFGNRMRCSACHNSGGPILKELFYPHNDWWQQSRPLVFEPNVPDQDILALLQQNIDIDVFAQEVQIGMDQIAKNKRIIDFQNNLSLQEQLRPLFCTTEINLESSPDNLKNRVAIPSAFWINPVLGHIDLFLSAPEYNQLIEDFDMQFPEVSLRDADHRWHTPVKGTADIEAIKNLIRNKTINKEFVEAVLMIDFTHPVFSSTRCELLKVLPIEKKPGWVKEFLANLQQKSSSMEGASLLVEYIIKQNNHDEFIQKIDHYKYSLNQQLSTKVGLINNFQRLIDLRKEVSISELSQNPSGQILEPGFRVIFPESKIMK